MSHYYALVNGVVTPRHFVAMTKNPSKLRPTRITDVRKFWKAGEPVMPSVTTIQNTAAKMALERWRIRQYLAQAYEYIGPRGTLDEYTAEIERLTELELDKAPTAGTDFHGHLEQYLARELPADHEYYALCAEALAVVVDRTGIFRDDWQAEQAFVHDSGFGGKCDLSAPGWIVDYKTKTNPDKWRPGKMAYPDHAMQLAAYRVGLGDESARCANVFICPATGEVDWHEHQPDTLAVEYQRFLNLTRNWWLSETGSEQPQFSNLESARACLEQRGAGWIARPIP